MNPTVMIMLAIIVAFNQSHFSYHCRLLHVFNQDRVYSSVQQFTVFLQHVFTTTLTELCSLIDDH